ncbi:leucine zipper domain-containing protein [Actinomadura sp. NPDC000600]|uniref:leucine zipper domain-containing protein n=1 Tax=Actinomadura sp. NPDC000600 TaxID=3154262 RepID=UPI0011EF938E
MQVLPQPRCTRPWPTEWRPSTAPHKWIARFRKERWNGLIELRSGPRARPSRTRPRPRTRRYPPRPSATPRIRPHHRRGRGAGPHRPGRLRSHGVPPLAA